MIKLKDIFEVQYANKTTLQRVSAVDKFTAFEIKVAGDKYYEVEGIEIDNDKHVIVLVINE